MADPVLLEPVDGSGVGSGSGGTYDCDAVPLDEEAVDDGATDDIFELFPPDFLY